VSGTDSTGKGFGPQQAARLLARLATQVDRQLDRPLVVSVLRAAVFLAGYGASWLLVRGQHPFRGPNELVLIAFALAVTFVIVAPVKSLRQPSGQGRAALAIWLSAWPATALLIGALQHDGASRGLIYGVLSASGPLVIISAAWAANAATRGEWLEYGLSVGLAVAGVIGAFFGPVGAWAVTGICCALVFLGHAAARELLGHRALRTAGLGI
jgi:hypothetical protein